MTVPDSLRTVKAELPRWTRDPVTLVTMGALVGLCGVLSYLAVNVATGDASSGGGGLQLQTSTVLDAGSTDDELAAMARSSLTMLVPIAAIALGVRAAGGEMSSGALLQLAVATRRLRRLFLVRAGIVLVLVGVAGAASAVVALAGTDAAISGAPEVAHLSAWHSAGSTIAGAAAQGVLIGLIAFGLAALTRRWVAITIAMIVYLVGLEPLLTGLLGRGSVWLPRAATSELLVPGPDLAHVAPTVACALVLATMAVLSLRRDRAAR
ncbi:hypothetical protein [uncultured Modestobacter sp.]|uniref:hypothetical protein n=1 Tax=uncultured Modestobacter sp. TaxID=380048 RepID=UPI0026341724|nr:hypothetical protein [uncultured Modestobacter sp.]